MEEEYIIGKTIGKGAFSVVKQCIHKKSGNTYAVKIIEKKNINDKLLMNEIDILKKTESHPNIVKLIEVFTQDDNVFIVMELVHGGELYEELISYGPWDESRVYQLFIQVADAVAHLHSKNIVHRDLKLQNILITPDSKIKLTDFGLSKIRNHHFELMQTRCGTPTYVAPEVIGGEDYDIRVDNWSLGVILYVLLHCQYPFMGSGIGEIFEQIQNGEPEFPAITKNPLSQEAKDLILNLLQREPSKRLTLNKIPSHPWCKKYQNMDILGKS